MIVCARCNTGKAEAGARCPQCGSCGDATSAAFAVAAAPEPIEAPLAR